MSWRTHLNRILVFTLIIFSLSGRANEASDRDAELMTALQIIAARDGGWSRKDWQDFGLRVAKYTAYTAVATGVGTTLYYVIPPRGFAWRTKFRPNKTITKLMNLAKDHGGKVALLGITLPFVNNVVNRLTAMNSVSEEERLRNASTPDARVYRSHLRKFLRLKLSEQFLIARQDEGLIDDLIRLARWIEAETATGVVPVLPGQVGASPAREGTAVRH